MVLWLLLLLLVGGAGRRVLALAELLAFAFNELQSSANVRNVHGRVARVPTIEHGLVENIHDMILANVAQSLASVLGQDGDAVREGQSAQQAVAQAGHRICIIDVDARDFRTLGLGGADVRAGDALCESNGAMLCCVLKNDAVFLCHF